MNYSISSTKVSIWLSAFLILVSLGTHGHAQSPDEASLGIVMIEKMNGFGAGILVGNDKETVYIATAYHNLWQSGESESPYQDLKVILFKAQDFIAHGTADPVFHDKIVDLAVMTVPLAEVGSSLPSDDECAVYGDASGLSRGDEVFTVGYNDLIRWNSPAFKPAFYESRKDKFLIEAANVTTGSSGGGVFDDEGRLVGMVNSKSTNSRMNCSHMKHIVAYFESHGLPTNLLRTASGSSVQTSSEDGAVTEERSNNPIDAEDREPNNTKTQSTPLAFGKPVEGRVSPSDVEDWYVVTPPKNGLIHLSAQNLHTNRDVQMGRLGSVLVFGTQKKKLGGASKYGGLKPTLSMESKPISVSANEKYYIQVKSQNGTNTAPYRLLVVFEP